MKTVKITCQFPAPYNAQANNVGEMNILTPEGPRTARITGRMNQVGSSSDRTWEIAAGIRRAGRGAKLIFPKPNLCSGMNRVARIVARVEVLTIFALIAGPILAVQVQKWIQRARERKLQRLYTFKRLMATRGAILSPGHVEALNMIDLEFAGEEQLDVEVRTAWKEYLDNLGDLPKDPDKAQVEAWGKRNRDFLANLLVSMGEAVGFDRVQILKGIYTPVGHTNFELETQAIRRGLVAVLWGDRAIPMDVRTLPPLAAPPPTPPDSLRPSGSA